MTSLGIIATLLSYLLAKRYRTLQGILPKKKSPTAIRMFSDTSSRCTDSLFPRHDVDLSARAGRAGRAGREDRQIPDQYDLARAAGWEPYNLHDITTCFLGWICTMEALYNNSQRQARV